MAGVLQTPIDAALRRARQALGALAGQWREDLRDLLPPRLREALRLGHQHLVLELDAERVTVHRGGQSAEEVLAVLPLGVPRAGHARPEPWPGGAPEHVTLLLPPASVLVKRVTLPLAADENLREVLGFEMDRHTPFLAEQVYYDYRVLSRSAATGSLEVELWVTARDRVDPILDELDGLGLAPDVMGIAHPGSADALAPGRLNLLPPARRPRRSALVRRLNLALGVATLLLLAAVLTQPLLAKRVHLRELERAVAAAQVEAQEVAALRERLERIDASARALVERKRSTPLVADLLDEVTRVLPDDTWLTRFEVSGDEVQLQGESAAAAALIPLLQASPMLADPRFRAPVTQNPREQAERFDLSCRVVRKGPG
jgi:general secretion pathway protein L